MKSRKFLIPLTLALSFGSTQFAAAQGYRYGAGATMPAPYMASTYNPNPTQGWVYRSLAPLEPYAQRGTQFGQGAMRCSAGGMAFIAGGPVAAGVGCVAGVMIR